MSINERINWSNTLIWLQRTGYTSPASYLEVDHVPETLQVSTCRLLLSTLELTVVHKTTELKEALCYEQLSLTHHGADLATNWN